MYDPTRAKNNYIYMNKFIPKLPAEEEFGNKEYKLKLVEKEKDKCDRLASQMIYRLYEGEGKAIYILGVSDSGNVIGISQEELDETINTILKAVTIINAESKKARIYNGSKGYIATIRVSKKLY